MNSNNNEFKSSFITSMLLFYDFCQKNYFVNNLQNYILHLQNPKVLMLTSFKPYIVI